MKIKNCLVLVFLLLSSVTYAQTAVNPPVCYGYDGKPLSVQNESVIQMKTTLPNLVKRQVLVSANLTEYVGVIPTHFGNHLHFIVALRSTKEAASLIEISHSLEGYTSPSASDLSAGPILICGEYSTTDVNGTPKITKFTPSKTGAMIHWTHQANRSGGYVPGAHPSGWIFANGKVFGMYP